MKYENLENLKNWLEINDKHYNDSDTYMQAVLSELFTKYCETGATEYELSQFESIGGYTITYSYDVDAIEHDNNFEYIFKF